MSDIIGNIIGLLAIIVVCAGLSLMLIAFGIQVYATWGDHRQRVRSSGPYLVKRVKNLNKKHRELVAKIDDLQTELNIVDDKLTTAQGQYKAWDFNFRKEHIKA